MTDLELFYNQHRNDYERNDSCVLYIDNGICTNPTTRIYADGIIAPIKQRKRVQGTLHKLTPNHMDKFECPYCDKLFDKQPTASEHITRIHSKEAGRPINPFACTYCTKVFKSSTQRNHHISNHHEIKYTHVPIYIATTTKRKTNPHSTITMHELT
jgi:uncharacterized C2H2 Zn-finger protein